MSKKLYIIILLAFIGLSVNAQWQQTSLDTDVRCLAIKGDTIFVGTYYGMYLSPDDGNSWDSTLTGCDIFSLAISENNIFAGASFGAYMSQNRGSTWSMIGLGCCSVTAIAIKGDTIFAGTAMNSAGMSPDSGSSWVSATGLPTYYSAGCECYLYYKISSFAISGNNIFAGTYGIYLASNYGTIWAAKGLSNYGVTALAISGNNIFAGTWGDGVYLSSDNGNSWNAVNTGLPNSAEVDAIVISGNNIFAGTYNNGVYFSLNNGQLWSSLNTGLTNSKIEALAIKGDTLFAGTGLVQVFGFSLLKPLV